MKNQLLTFPNKSMVPSMRYLHYPTLENTRSIKKLRTNMYILLNDQSSWRITRTSANGIRHSRFNIVFIHFIFVISIQYSSISSERNLTASRLPAGFVDLNNQFVMGYY